MSDVEDDDPPPDIHVGDLTPREINRIILGSSPDAVREAEIEMHEEEFESQPSFSNAQAPQKRAREESSASGDDGDCTVYTSQRRKRMVTANYPPSFNNNEKSFWEVAVTSTEVLPKQLGFAKFLHNEEIQDVVKVTYKNPYKILIRFKTKRAAETLCDNKNLKAKGWSCRMTDDVVYTYGVIRDVEKEESEEEIKKVLECEAEILSVKRLLMKDDKGKWKASDSIRVCFKGANLPPYVTAYGCRMRVDPFTFPVTQCSKCWKYGHVRRFCPSKAQLCPKCGGEHDNCMTDKLKCINCKGDHMSLLKSICPAFKREKDIRKYMVDTNCTYKVALREMKELKETRQMRHDLNNREEVNEIENNCSIEHDVSPSYADVLSGKAPSQQSMDRIESEETLQTKNEPKASTKKKVVSTKKKSKKKRHTKNQEQPVSTEDNNSSDAMEEIEENKESRRKSLFTKFLEKLKEIIFARYNISTKIDMILTLIVMAVKEVVMKYFNLETVLRLINLPNQDGWP